MILVLSGIECHDERENLILLMSCKIGSLVLILVGKMSKGISIGLNELLDLGPSVLPVLFVSDALDELLKLQLGNHLLLLFFLLVLGVHGGRELHPLNRS